MLHDPAPRPQPPNLTGGINAEREELSPVSAPPASPTSADVPGLDYRRLFETSPNLFLVVNLKGVIVAVSDAFLRATMTTRDDLVGRHTFEIFPDNPDDPQTRGVSALTESWQRVIATGIPREIRVTSAV